MNFKILLSTCTSNNKTKKNDTSTSTKNPPIPDSNQFETSVLPKSLHNNNYINSTFINKDNNRIYFLHSILSPNILDNHSSLHDYNHTKSKMLPKHTTTTKLK